MLNKKNILKTAHTTPKQILADVELQSSVGCFIAQTAGVDVGGKKIAKAGTPIKINMGDLVSLATKEVAANANAVLLHDVDVTGGSNNGTALIFGFVNVNRLDTDIQALVTPGTAIGMVQFIKC